MVDVEQFLMSLRTHKNADGKLNPIYLADTIQKEIEIIQEAIKHSQRWVGLTDEDFQIMYDKFAKYQEYGAFVSGWEDFFNAVQDKLKEKNK